MSARVTPLLLTFVFIAHFLFLLRNVLNYGTCLSRWLGLNCFKYNTSKMLVYTNVYGSLHKTIKQTGKKLTYQWPKPRLPLQAPHVVPPQTDYPALK